jgi:hypothetical protein
MEGSLKNAFASIKALTSRRAQEIYHPGRPHGLTATRQDEINPDWWNF